MINLLIEFIFWLINTIYGIIINPLINGFISLIPGASTYFGYIADFVSTVIIYASTALRFLLIPQTAITMLFAYFQIKLSIIILFKTYKLIMNLYTRLKP